MSQRTLRKERIIPIQIEGENEVQAEENNDIASLTSSSAMPDQTNNTTEEDKPILPYCNPREKIIIVIDCAEDDNTTNFNLNNNSHKPIYMVKRAVELFLNLKQAISKQHEYAVVILNENSASWLLGFSNNTVEIVEALEKISSCQVEDIFNLNDIFDVIMENVELPVEVEKSTDVITPPLYVVRTILFYGRSYTVPKLKITPAIKRYLESPFFTFDVLMTHEPLGDDNNCKKIFKALQNVDKKGLAYFFPVARDAKMLFNSIGKLLAHPLQRTCQQWADCTMKS